jgi:histidinol-phosphatase (PHP family)
MLTNYHTHTTFCDGKNTAEELVLQAIDLGFDALGFSGHGYTSQDNTYCMQNTKAYIEEVKRLKEKYAKKIQIYVGVEEDSREYVNRDDFDYIIGSSHYVAKDGQYFSVDHSHEYFKKALESFNGDYMAYAKNYYERLVGYLVERKPDVIGHFDLITKFDELESSVYLENPEYKKLAQESLLKAIKSQSIFEVNTGAIARGLRTSPYPSIELLYLLKKNDGKLMINTDCHKKEKLDFYIKEAKFLLKDIGFKYVYVLFDNEFKKDYL